VVFNANLPLNGFEVRYYRINRVVFVKRREDMEISVIVPIYNAEAHIHTPINSLKSQTIHDFEVLLINDGSTDNTLSIINELIQNDQRFRLISQKNMGPGAARNRGLKEAKGTYISFLDSDDYFHNSFLEKMHSKLKKSDADIVICDFELVSPSREVIDNYISGITSSINGDEAFTELMRGNRISSISANKLFKKELFDNIEYLESVILGEDTATIYKLLLEAKNITFVNEILFSYIYRNNSTVNSFSIARIDDLLIVSASIKEFLVKNGLFSKYKHDFEIFYLTDIAFAMAFKISKFSNNRALLKEYIKRLDRDIFSLNNILLLIKNHKRKMIALLLLKSTIPLFNTTVKLWLLKNSKRAQLAK